MFNGSALAGKVAFISGGTSGINLGIAIGFAQRGAKVAVIGRDLAKAERAAAKIIEESGGEAIGLSADVRDYAALDDALRIAREKFGKINIVIAGAAGNFPASAVNLSAKGFRTVVEIDLLGTYNLFRAAFDHIEKQGASLIAMTAGGAVKPMPYQLHACAAKAGVNMVVKCLAMEWGPAGIRVNAISPGPIEGTEGAGDRMIPPDRKQQFIQSIPLRRFGTAEEIANAAIFLSSDLARYITGLVLDCEGGYQLGDASLDCLTVIPRQ